ncbi:DUF397 domain-containing protein [Streptomyces sp. NPDC052236]|uniref:DUF397 domain-containing protein n=1 Tax=Streptomyces sp. NPDC052236 TaxID=3365686 RepID=UPI0037D7948B
MYISAAELTSADWFTSSYSNDQGGNCVEVAHLRDQVGVRDSKLAGSPVVAVSTPAWSGFLSSIQDSRPTG